MSEIRAEMSATVFQVHVAVGDAVAVDDPIVTLESMKMEIPLGATVAGTVLSVGVAVGDLVEEGATVAVLGTGGA